MARSGYELLGLVTQLGLSVVITVGAAAWVGQWLDSRLGKSYTFTALGVVVGVAAALYSAYQTLESFFAPHKGGGDPD